MRLVLIRHGQTRSNVELRLSGWTDDPLDELGLRQAKATARRLAAEGPVTRIYASPLMRARATAEHVAAALGVTEVIERPGLRERNFGLFESMTLQAIAEQFSDMAAAWAERGAIDWGPPEGELPHEFHGRIMGELKSIVERHRDDERVVVVTHGGVISVALATWLTGEPTRWREYFVRNCSITELEFHSEPRLIRFNEYAELDD